MHSCPWCALTFNYADPDEVIKHLADHLQTLRESHPETPEEEVEGSWKKEDFSKNIPHSNK